MKEYLSIGELASIFKITVQLLRHYDEKGLLIPEIRDPVTGHRKYRFDQMYKLATIRYLRKLGYPLDSIGKFMLLDDFDQAIAAMRDQSEILKKKYNELLLTDNIIQKKLAFIDSERKKIIPGKIDHKEYPDRYYSLIGDEMKLFTNELFYFYPTIGFYSGEHKKFGAYLLDHSDIINFIVSRHVLERSVLPAGTYASTYHFGPYQSIRETIERLLSHEGYEKNTTAITFNIIDQFIATNPEKYVTEIQVQTV